MRMMVSLLRCERRSIRPLTISRFGEEKGSKSFWRFFRTEKIDRPEVGKVSLTTQQIGKGVDDG
ncbi:hypothetical protein [Mesorhizobium sanjuanii]|uniref:hypothetical protein n=1 Tax=Mesorhizobium sanjuanii TaxID=2037900 RepID=UPI00105625AE|nr:hypothetical protein [Mesorhizobium sanjuanii]